MSDQPAPYTGHASQPAQPDAALSGPPQPAHPTLTAPRPAAWHSRALLLALTGVALVGLVLTWIGGQGFPYNAPVEQLYCFGLVVDLFATAIAAGILAIVEFTRRGNPDRASRPTDTRISVFAILAIALSALAAIAWAAGGGIEQLVLLLQGVRTRYMYATGSLFLAGIPWALGMVFGAWGFRPGGHRITNVLALVAVGLGVLLIIPTATAALVYGAGLSD
jgi:hypothetical protein